MSTPRSHQAFPSLPVINNASPHPRAAARVCLVSPEFVGPGASGGIGTAYTAMAEALSAAGHEVTCLYTKAADYAAADIVHWISSYRKQKIELIPLPRSACPIDAAPHAVRSYEVYAWLKENNRFDIIHFPEWQGLGYYTQLAKRQGLALANTHLCVGLHSMTEWLKFANREYLAEINELQLDHMERQSVALADSLVSPSQYLLNWIAGRGWTLPERCYVQQNIMPRSARSSIKAFTKPSNIHELVFFGRLETRKGVQLFCDALDRLAIAKCGNVEQVTFLGRSAFVENEHGENYIKKRAQAWPWKVQFLMDRNQPEALDYLRGDGRLAIIASLIENSPYTVLECLGAGIAFLASHVGGIPELIAPVDAQRVCFEPTPVALFKKLKTALSGGFQPARPSISVTANEQAWVTWHEQLLGSTRSQQQPQTPVAWPKVSLCLTTFNRPKLLKQAIASIKALTYPNLEVILVDDGSTQPDALSYIEHLKPIFESRGWKVIQQENRYLGAARNCGAKHATGDFLLFMDDDNCAEPHEVTTLVTAMLHSGADILSCGMNYFHGEEAPGRQTEIKGRWLPLGGCVSAGAFINSFGDANALIRRQCFEAIGGFTEDYGVTHEDWEFHAKAVLRGFNLQVVPEFLFWYRANAGSMIRTLPKYPNYMRSIRPYIDKVDPELKNLVLYAQAIFLTGTNRSEVKTWADLTIKWRSKLEAGIALAQVGQHAMATKMMLQGIKEVETCKHPRVLLDALLGIAPHLARLDPGRARFLLELAASSALQIQSAADHERARALIAELPSPENSPPGTRKNLITSAQKQTA